MQNQVAEELDFIVLSVSLGFVGSHTQKCAIFTKEAMNHMMTEYLKRKF